MWPCANGYQVHVASSLKRLGKGEPDLWDSRRVESDKTIHVIYHGKPLASRMACHRRVRVWDQDGRVSQRSRPAFWTMGLLRDED